MINSLFLKHNDKTSMINLQEMLKDISDAQLQILNMTNGISITNREIGEVVFSTLPIISPNYMELDGRTFSESAYPNFYKHLRLLKAKFPEYFCESTEYDAYMSEYHICPLFVLDEENRVARIPRISGFVEASGLTAHGFNAYNTVSDETIPNLKGDFGSVTGSNSTRISYASTHTGVFSNTEQRNTKRYMSITSGEATDNSWGATFDASAYDKRYKDGAKLHPQSTVLKVYMVVGRDQAYPHVVYSWSNDDSFVRVYSDGYCTQEGKVLPTENTQDEVTFNFPFKSNVNVQVTPYRMGGGENRDILITNVTNTSFTVEHSQFLGLSYRASGKVDLSIVPHEIDYSAQSTDVLEMMEYEKEIKTKLSKTVLVTEMPPEEERDPEAMYVVVSPENIRVVQDVTNNFYGNPEQEEFNGSLQATFNHSGEYTEQEETQTEDVTVNVSVDNPEQIIEFNDFNELPEISEIPDHVKVTSISKNQVKVNYISEFVPETHEDSKEITSERTDTENGEHFEGSYNFNFYHSGKFNLNIEEKSETFEFTSPNEDYTLNFSNTYDTVPTITSSENSEVQIISISTNRAVIRGHGSVTVTGTVTTRVFDTETKNDTLTRTLAFGKVYEEPVITIPENAPYTVELSEDKKYCTVTVGVEKSVAYGTPEVIEGTYTVDVHETHIELPTIEDEENTFQGDVYPEGKPEDTQTAEVTEHTSDETSESFVGTMRATAYHSGEYTEESTEKSLTSSAKDLDTVLGYKVMKFGFAYDNVPKVQNSTNGEVLRLTEKHAILSQDTSEGDITVSGTATFKKFEPETVSKTVEKVLEFNNAYEKEPQYDVAGTGVTVEPLQTEAPYTSVKVSKEVTGTVEYGAPLEISEEFKVNVNRTQITYTYDDGTSEVIVHHNDEPVTLTMDDGSTDTTTVGELAKAFENGQ